MSADDDYNGWANYESWTVHSWLSSDQPNFERLSRLAKAATSKYVAADQLKAWVKQRNPLVSGGSMFSDLLGHAIDRVDWVGIAEALRG